MLFVFVATGTFFSRISSTLTFFNSRSQSDPTGRAIRFFGWAEACGKRGNELQRLLIPRFVCSLNYPVQDQKKKKNPNEMTKKGQISHEDRLESDVLPSCSAPWKVHAVKPSRSEYWDVENIRLCLLNNDHFTQATCPWSQPSLGEHTARRGGLRRNHG